VPKNPQNDTDGCRIEKRSRVVGEAATGLKESNSDLRRRIEYLTALHETAIGLLDLLDKEELLETILYRVAPVQRERADRSLPRSTEKKSSEHRSVDARHHPRIESEQHYIPFYQSVLSAEHQSDSHRNSGGQPGQRR